MQEDTRVTRIEIRFSHIPSVILTPHDLKQLAEELRDILKDAKSSEIESIKKKYTDLEKQKHAIRDLEEDLQLRIDVRSKSGTQLKGGDGRVFDESQFPHDVKNVSFELGPGWRDRPSLEIELSFPDFDRHNHVKVSGENTTWVNGAYGRVKKFFDEKRAMRNTIIYNNKVFWPLVAVFGCWILFRVIRFGIDTLPKFVNQNEMPKENYENLENNVLFITTFVAVPLIFFAIPRLIKLIFPRIEFQFAEKKGIAAFRSVLWVLFLGVLAAFLYDILKTLF